MDFIKKLINKAELCRYCHSLLHEKNQLFRRIKDFSILFLSLLLPLLVGLYYREILEDWVLISALVIPLIISLIQGLDNILFHWTDKVIEHQKSLHIWGEFIREADLINKNCKNDEEKRDKEVNNIYKKYLNCMEKSITIPNKYFLKYKQDFKKYKLRSKKIDTMTLEKIG